jgi:hypothetical protein
MSGSSGLADINRTEQISIIDPSCVTVYFNRDRPQAESLIGKRLVKIHGSEYTMTLTFEDGSTMECGGSCYGGVLSVEYGQAKESK